MTEEWREEREGHKIEGIGKNRRTLWNKKKQERKRILSENIGSKRRGMRNGKKERWRERGKDGTGGEKKTKFIIRMKCYEIKIKERR